MNTYELFLCLLFPARCTPRTDVKRSKRVKEAEEFEPWWAVRRQGHVSVEKTMDIESVNILTASIKKVG